jgi:phenylacetate-coenzyme A ligase PaaK-like adenylate-forming protein
MTLTGKLRARLYRDGIARHAALYDSRVSDSERAALQLAALNAEWARIVATTDYWGSLVRGAHLPGTFASLAEFVRCVPSTSRQAVQQHGPAMTSRSKRPDMVRMTGGSTSTPIQLPAWKSEDLSVRDDRWCGRTWYGVDPGSRLFLVWGHGHLLGSGARGWIRARRLEISDRLLGYRRFSAYDLQPAKMRRAADDLLAFRPDYVIGYSVALDLLARTNADRGSALRGLGLRVVIGTAESFPSEDSVQVLRDTFGCPIAMEYGSVEVGVIAHTHPGGGYRVFWKNLFVEAVGEGPTQRLLLTTLYPRAFPLVRYEIGDEVETTGVSSDTFAGLAEFRRVVGRCNDYVVLNDGFTVHSEVFSHAIRPCSAVRGFQIRQDGDDLRILYTSPDALPSEQESGILDRLRKVHPSLGAIRLERVAALEQTIAGKTRMILRR